MSGVVRAREGRRGRAQTEKGKGMGRNIGMLGRMQVTPRWADDPARRQDIRMWRECQVRRVLPLPEGHRTAGREGGVGQE